MSLLHSLIFILFCTVLVLTCQSTLYAQTEAYDYGRIGFATVASPWVTDYQASGINPANLGFIPTEDVYALGSPLEFGITRSKRTVAISIGEIGASIHSDALPRSGLFDAMFQNTSGTFTTAQKLEVAKQFIDKGLRYSLDALILGASYQTEDYGGFAFTVRERVYGTFVFNHAAAQVIFAGRSFEYFDSTALNFAGDTVGYSTNPQNYSSLFVGTQLSLLWFRESALSYGIQIFNNEETKVFVGVTGKYLSGYASLDATTTDGEFKAQSALSPFFGVSYGKATSPSLIRGTSFIPVGSGWGFDAGISVKTGKFSLSGSIIDVGKIEWTGNVFRAKDTVLNGMSSTGFNSYNIFVEAPQITGEGKFFSWEGLVNSTTSLPSRLRVGVGYDLTAKWRFGAETVIPVNTTAGQLGQAIITAGADWRPLPWLRVGAGLAGGGNMRVTVPLGAHASLFGGIWELGITSRDLLTTVLSDNPVVSIGIGLSRFRL